MHLYALDKNRKLISLINPVNIQWNRKYYECGDFSIQLPVEQHNNDMFYLYMYGRDELGIINKTVYTYERGVMYVQLSGFFCEKLLDKFVITSYTKADSIGNIVVDMFNTFFKPDENENLPGVTIGDVYLGEVIGYDVRNRKVRDLGKAIYDLLRTQNMSYKLKYDYAKDTFVFTVYKGLDRTQDQNVNPYVVFSDKFNNINNVTYTVDNSNLRNYYIVKVKKNDNTVDTYNFDLSNGGKKYQQYLELSGDLSYSEIKQAVAENSTSYSGITNLDVTPNLDFYKYLDDFNLGDVCDIILSHINVQYTSRITSIYEVYKGDMLEISLELGDKIPSLLNKARL